MAISSDCLKLLYFLVRDIFTTRLAVFLDFRSLEVILFLLDRVMIALLTLNAYWYGLGTRGFRLRYFRLRNRFPRTKQYVHRLFKRGGGAWLPYHLSDLSRVAYLDRIFSCCLYLCFVTCFLRRARLSSAM